MKHPVADRGIRFQVITLFTIPTLIIGLLLSIYIVHTRLEDTRQTLEHRGMALARHLAPITEFGIYTGDRQLLNKLVVRFLEEPGVSAITILDRDKRVLVRAISEVSSLVASSSLMTFTEPVVTSSIDINDFPETIDASMNSPQSKIIGWVKVDMTAETTASRNRDILRNSLLISLSGLLFSILLGVRLGRRITAPIIRLKEALDRLQNGDMETRVAEVSQGEIGALEEGFNTMAEAISASQRELERHVKMATARLKQNLITLAEKNIELEEARLQALHSGEEKSAFLFNMSHEIRTPLNAIIGYTQLLEKTPLDEQQQEYIQIVRHSSRQLLTIIDDILNFARLEAGKVVLERVPFDLHGCCENTIAMLMPAARDKDIDLALLIHSDVPKWIYGDGNRLNQILSNLLGNAIKFTPSFGNVSLQVSMDKTADGPETIEFRVIDTGIGMDESAVSHIFEQFRQGDDSITRRYGGTGLGLAIVSRLVDLMDGQIHIDSQPGKGTIVSVRQPCERYEHSVDASAREEIWLDGLPCLLFDRNPVERRAIRNQLLATGADVFVAKKREVIEEMLEQAKRRGRPIGLIIAGLQRRHHDFEHLPDDIFHCRQFYGGHILLIVDDIEQSHAPILATDDMLTALPRPVNRSALTHYLERFMGRPGTWGGEQADEAPSQTIEGLRILLAEDNELNRRLITTILDGNGCEIVTTINGYHALNTLCAEPFDLLLLDIHLPELDGIELARQIRAMDGPIKDIPIIALTADIYRGRRSFLAASGIDGCVFKPMDEKILIDCIAAVIHDRNSPACWPGQSDPRLTNVRQGQHRPSARIVAELEKMRPKLLAELEQHLAILHGIDTNDASLAEINHNLSGLAGAFGLEEIYAATRAIEEHLHNDQSCPPETMGALIAAIERTLTELEMHSTDEDGQLETPID